jgi:general stress protein YciG
MDPARQKEIASKGGRAAHEKGTAHEWSTDEARNAGRKGGVTVSRDRAHMAAIGREGGESRSAAARQTRLPGNTIGNTAGNTEREMVLTVAREGLADVGRATPPSRPADRGHSADVVRPEPEVRTGM